MNTKFPKTHASRSRLASNFERSENGSLENISDCFRAKNVVSADQPVLGRETDFLLRMPSKAIKLMVMNHY